MKAKLIKVLREQDHNGSTKVLARYSKDVELLMVPQVNDGIRVANVNFFVDIIIQDLNTSNILLYENIDINHYDIRNYKGFRKERKILSNDGWKLYN